MQKYEVSITYIAGVIDMSVANTEQIRLPSNTYLKYCPKICLHLLSIQVHICVKFEVCITNISGVTSIKEAKREQRWLLNNEYLKYCPNYLFVYLQYIDAHVCTICS